MLNTGNYYDTLTKPEQRKLKGILRKEQGSMDDARNRTGITEPTLNRAAAGMRIRQENAKTIRTILLNQKLKTISEIELTNEG